MVLTTLAHHIDVEWLREAYRRTRKDGAVGVDGQTATQYAAALEGNLENLLSRFKTGQYLAPPVRRVHIPKGEGGKTRPIGVPTFEDKVLQRAVVMALEPIYEQDFRDCSYGFRPGRSAHDALESLWKGVMDVRGGWVLEVDIRSFFDAVDHRHLRNFLDQRVRDGVIRRAIDKWLKAGVMESGAWSRPKSGTPQGGVLSPLLANIYLHEVLDRWYERDVIPKMRGRSHLVRYADDFVMTFEREDDARRVHAVLAKRFARFGLTLHPDKTRLFEFRRPGKGTGGRRPPTFDFLGFTHYWGRSRKGSPVVKRKTSKGRLARAIKRTSAWCRRYRHASVAAQHRALSRKVQGHYAYYGITGNARSLAQFVHEVERNWRKWLDRRSRKAGMDWERFRRLLQRYPLPPPRVVHSIYRAANPSS